MKRLDDALRGRDKRIGFIEPPDFRENMERVNRGIKKIKERFKLEDAQD
jgi:hypothetical protein